MKYSQKIVTANPLKNQKGLKTIKSLKIDFKPMF